MVKNIRIKIQKSILILIKMYYFKHNFIDILLINNIYFLDNNIIV
jgi:hypothetical protein